MVIARKVAQVTITNAVRKRAGQAILQNVTDQVAAKLAANPALAKTVLSRPEYWLAQRLPWFAKMKYGKAVEMLAARDIEKTPGLDSLFKHLGGPMKPDFVGVGALEGMRFDITTVAGAASHYGRPLYRGPGLTIITYERAATFTVFPK